MSISLMPSGADPVTMDVAGHPVVLHHGDPGAEYHALRHTALVFDRTHRGRSLFEGVRARETLTGLVTNDALGLEPGQGQYAAALTPKGKIIADVRVYALAADRVLVDLAPRATEGWWTMVRKFVNPRVTPYRDLGPTWRHLGVFGPDARRLVATTTDIADDVLEALAPYAHRSVVVDGMEVVVARSPELGIDGYDCWTAGPFDALWHRIVHGGATPGGLTAWDVARVENGRPEWGLDMDESTLPQEANFDDWHALSYTKGCYTGQETVARIHFRGHVNRQLRGLRFDLSEPLARGSQLTDTEGKVLGDVRSTAMSPRLGAIALGMVRCEIAPGSVLIGRAPTGGLECPVLVHALPFAGH